MRNIVIITVCLIIGLSSAAQDSTNTGSIDSTFLKSLDEIVVTATRTERKLGNVAIPAVIISKKAIQLSGSLRLNDILQEQTGIYITSGSGSSAVGGGVFGNGVQLQGLSPDHTMILLDGEPLIGRQGGVMDLSRFAVGNIRKIEVVKGPSSSLYGSEAMGGVINIITEPLQGKQFNAGIRSGSFFTNDLFASGNYTGKKAAVYGFVNRNSSNGYELDKSSPEKTVDPFYNYTAHLKWSYKFSPKTKLIVSGRYFYAEQQSFFAINSPVINIGGKATTKDFNINPVITHQFNEKVKSSLRLVTNGYRFVQQLDSINSGKKYYADEFQQGFYRLENQTDVSINRCHMLVIGGGYTLQTVNTIRYRKAQQQQMWYGFAQHEWSGVKNMIVIAGLRYDYNTDFAARISPKLAVNYKVGEKIKFNASYGAGFKAPDFRQLYLSFNNNAAEGYSIYGANEFSMDLLEQQKNQGLIAAILPAANFVTKLRPETSNGFNLGVQLKPLNNVKIDINFFRNDVNDLVNYIPVATNTNGTSVFSYININRAFTQGAETNISYQLLKHLNISGGYQYLATADKTVLQAIRNNEVFGRDITGGSARLMTVKDYSGLLNRSKHMANLRLFLNDEKTGWASSLRLIYRSRFGVIDKDGNGFANMKEEFAPAMMQVNVTVSKQIIRRVNIQVGVNNLFNQTNARYMPNLPGVNWFAAIQYSFKK
jgi:outer membrane receptor for ferrienterochelin and colicins